MKFFTLLLIFAFSMALTLTNCGGSKSKKGAEDKTHAETSDKKDEHSDAKAEHKPHWAYEGDEGPDNWGKLHESFKQCAEGTSQSPIDISQAEEVDSLPELNANYSPTKLNIVNNGHTIQVNYAAGSSLTLGDKSYELLQFHFHSPSEHTVNGNPYDLEMHLVHKNEANELAVVGVVFKKGAENPFIKKIWEHMPTDINQPKDVDLELNVAESIPEDKKYFHYSGSLTTPPCSEGVNWNVVKAELEVSEEQIKQFVDLIKANNRPVQPVNERKVQVKK